MRHFYLTNLELAETARHYLKSFPDLAKTSIEVAEQACANKFRVPFTMVMNEWIDLGHPVDWLYNPTQDLEFTWVLNRHWYMLDLGKAYLLTEKEDYVKTFVAHFSGWRLQNPVPQHLDYEEAVFFQRPGPWRLLEVGLRVQSWIWTYQWMKTSTWMTEVFREEFMTALAEHAEFLTQYLGSTEINHASMHMQGLFMIGVFYKEHPKAPLWRQLAKERLELCMLYQIGPEGVQSELTTHYHNGSIEMFGTPYWLGKQTGFPMMEKYEANLRKMGAFTHALIRPDQSSTPAGDSDWIDQGRKRLGLLGAILDEPQFVQIGEISEDILWLVGVKRFEQLSDQTMELQPSAASQAFPITGYYVMKDEQQYLFFDAAGMGGAHGHADALNLEWMWKHQLLFVDPGRYTYEEGEWRRYFKSTRAHNTVTVDGLDQTPYISSQEWGSPYAETHTYRWTQEAEYDFIDASHDGYMRLEQPVVHRRWLLLGKASSVLIIVDWLEGEGEHDIEQRFQLHPNAVVNMAAAGDLIGHTTIDYPSAAIQLKMCWKTSAEQETDFTVSSETGWISRIYGVKEETPVIVGIGRMSGRFGIVTVCIPSDLENPQIPLTITKLEIDPKHQEVSIIFAGENSNLAIYMNSDCIKWNQS